MTDTTATLEERRAQLEREEWWKRNYAAWMALEAFDAAHPEIAAAQRAGCKAKRKADFNATSMILASRPRETDR